MEELEIIDLETVLEKLQYIEDYDCLIYGVSFLMTGEIEIIFLDPEGEDVLNKIVIKPQYYQNEFFKQLVEIGNNNEHCRIRIHPGKVESSLYKGIKLIEEE